MREAFHHDLEHVSEALVSMADLVEKALIRSTEALLSGDLARAESVIAADTYIDAAQTEIDDRIVDLLARESPVATDLRVLVSALRMSSSLERMGDLAKHVAIIARRHHPQPVVPPALEEHFHQMADLTVRAVRDAGTVVRTRDLGLAGEVEKRDDLLDDLHDTIYRELRSAESAVSALSVGQVVDLTLLARFYERTGDHAVSLVRRIGFLVTGEELNIRVLSPHLDLDDDAEVD